MNNHKNYIYDYLGWDKEKAPFSGAKRMEPEIRIELTTRCLRNSCSTTELHWHAWLGQSASVSRQAVRRLSSDSKQVKIARQLAQFVPYYLFFRLRFLRLEIHKAHGQANEGS